MKKTVPAGVLVLLLALQLTPPRLEASSLAAGLEAFDYLLGGEWIASPAQQDASGRKFRPAATWEASLDGRLVRLRLRYLYEDGSSTEALHGFFAWDPVAEKAVHWAVMKTGMLVTGSWEPSEERLGRIDFRVHWPDGQVSDQQPEQWRDVLVAESDDRYRDTSHFLRNGEWVVNLELVYERRTGSP